MTTNFDRAVYVLLGIPFDAVSKQEAVARLRNAMASHEDCLWVTPNVNFVSAAVTDTAFRASVLKAHLSTVDGMPLVWLARFMGIPLLERVSGSDVFDSLIEGHQKDSINTVFLFGGENGAAQAAHNELNSRGGPMRSVGWLSPGHGSVTDLSRPEDLTAIRNAHPDFLLVSLGAVKGQLWIDRNWKATGAPVISHLGAVLNFLAKRVDRAPRWIQRAGFEWLWRIFQEKSLWRRYYNDAKVTCTLLRKSIPLYNKLRKKWGELVDSHPPRIMEQRDDTTSVWILKGIFTTDGLSQLRKMCADLNQRPKNLVIDVSQVAWLDSAAMGVLVLLHSHQNQVNQTISWRGSNAYDIFSAHCCEYVLN
jgi:N-acetylglucosaminyldiphosphoundecaprenol N-acetyl-beta-D-mannosaminyltransferase